MGFAARLREGRILPVTMALMLVSMLMHGAAVIGGVFGGPDAVAAEPQAAQSMPAATSSSGGDAAPATADGASPAVPSPTPGEMRLLLDLRARRDELAAREAELAAREQLAAREAEKLDERTREMAALQARLETLEGARQKHDAENWAGLVTVYEQMKPREAAAIFDALDMHVLLNVLDRMQPKKTAAVLAAMAPERARLAT
jgi:flagellar motility protein MotE (MotC chaperone)